MTIKSASTLAEQWATEHGYPNNTTLTSSFAELVEIGQRSILESGVLLPGWECQSCRAFNGSAKELLANCRCCGRAR
jgi:hypothetical protein